MMKKSFLFLLLCLSAICGATATPVVNATNANAVTVDGVNVGVLQDAVANYPSLTGTITSSWTSGIPTDPVKKYPYFLAAYKAGILSGTFAITYTQNTVALTTGTSSTAALNQALQNWFGRNINPAINSVAALDYPTTNVSMRGVKRIVVFGDSIGQGYQGGTIATGTSAIGVVASGTVTVWNGSAVNNGSGSGEMDAYLCEHFANWATIPRINNCRGATNVNSGSPSLMSFYAASQQPYKPIAGERVYLFDIAGSTDLILNSRTATQLIADQTTAIAQFHADGFYVLLFTLPNAGSYSGSPATYRTTYNAWVTSGTSGADDYVDIDAVMTSGTLMAPSGGPHFNDYGYSVGATQINTHIPNP